VLALRERYGYPLAIPVEVTVAGSSGVGPLASDQDPEALVETLRAIAAATAPFSTAYGEVRRFPGTSIFWFSLQNEAPFRAIHERLKASGLRFEVIPFPYQPHCTIQTRRRTEAEEAELLALQVPGPIRFGEIALATLIERPGVEPDCPIIWRTPFVGT
jgi:2'-5' RNA ligase